MPTEPERPPETLVDPTAGNLNEVETSTKPEQSGHILGNAWQKVKNVIGQEGEPIAERVGAKLLASLAAGTSEFWLPVLIVVFLVIIAVIAISSYSNSQTNNQPRTAFQPVKNSQAAQAALTNILASVPKTTAEPHTALDRYVLPESDLTDLKNCQTKPADCPIDARVINLLDEFGRQFGHVEASIRDGYATNPPAGIAEGALSREQDPGKVPIISSHTLGQAIDIFALGSVSKVGVSQRIPTQIGWSRTTNDDLSDSVIPLMTQLAQTIQYENKTAADQNSDLLTRYSQFEQAFQKLPSFPDVLNQTDMQPVLDSWNGFIGSLRSQRALHDRLGAYDPTKPLNQLHLGQVNPFSKVGFTGAFWPTQSQGAHWSAFYASLDATFSTVDKLVRESRTSADRRASLSGTLDAGKEVLTKAEKAHQSQEIAANNQDPLDQALADRDFTNILNDIAASGQTPDFDQVMKQVQNKISTRQKQSGWTEEQETAAQTIDQVSRILDQANQTKTDVETVKQQIRDQLHSIQPTVEINVEVSQQVDDAVNFVLANSNNGKVDGAAVREALKKRAQTALENSPLPAQLLDELLSKVDPTILTLAASPPTSADVQNLANSITDALAQLGYPTTPQLRQTIEQQVNQNMANVMGQAQRTADSIRQQLRVFLPTLVKTVLTDARSQIDEQALQAVLTQAKGYVNANGSINKSALETAAKQQAKAAILNTTYGQDYQDASASVRELNQALDQYIKDGKIDVTGLKKELTSYVHQQIAEQITQPLQAAKEQAISQAKQEIRDELKSQINQRFSSGDAAVINAALSGDVNAQTLAYAALDTYCNAQFGPIAGPIVSGIVKGLFGGLFGGDSISHDMDQLISSTKQLNGQIEQYEEKNPSQLKTNLALLDNLKSLSNLGVTIDAVNRLPNPAAATATTPAIASLADSLGSLQALSALDSLATLQTGADLQTTSDLKALNNLRYLGELRQLAHLNPAFVASLPGPAAVTGDADEEPTDARTTIATALRSLDNLKSLKNLQTLDRPYDSLGASLANYDSLTELSLLGNLGDMLANQPGQFSQLNLAPLRLLGSDQFSLKDSVWGQLGGKDGLGLAALAAWANPTVASTFPSLTLSKVPEFDLLHLSDSNFTAISSLGQEYQVDPTDKDAGALVKAAKLQQDMVTFRPAAEATTHAAILFAESLPSAMQPKQILAFDQDGSFDPSAPAVGSILSQTVIDHLHFGF